MLSYTLLLAAPTAVQVHFGDSVELYMVLYGHHCIDLTILVHSLKRLAYKIQQIAYVFFMVTYLMDIRHDM